jgi:DNA-binding transcriptional ArsR family regulator
MSSSKISSLMLRSRNVKNKLVKILKQNSKGLTITELVGKSSLSRSAIIVELAKLEGANKVSVRRAGMAKIYSLIKEDKK